MNFLEDDGTESSRSAAAPGAAAAEPSPKAGDGSQGASADDGLVQSVVRCFAEVFAASEGLVEVHADRARSSLRRAIVKAIVGAGLAVTAVVWVCTAAFAAVRGACGGLTELWGGRVWLGELSGGLLALAFAAGAFALHSWWTSRREFAHLNSKYERMRNERERQDEPEIPAPLGG